MNCPNCNSTITTVRDSRPSPDGTMRRRRHRCSRGHTFSTIETYENISAWNGNREMKALMHAMKPVMKLINESTSLKQLTNEVDHGSSAASTHA